MVSRCTRSMNTKHEIKNNSGRVFLVGAGPGDPRLISLRGREAIERADAIIYDRLVSRELLGFAKPSAELIYAGKSPGNHALSQEQINALLISRARSGCMVVRLKGGDPFIFGRGAEEALALAGAGIGFEVIPGVTAAVGACAYAGIPLTCRGKAGAAAFITGHESAESDGGPDWEALARFRGTLVFYMSVSRMGEICRKMIESGKPASAHAAVIEKGTLPDQRTVQGVLGGIAGEAKACGIRPPALLVIGDTVQVRESAGWYEKLPLYGSKVVITRSVAQSGTMSRAVLDLGGEPLIAPAIRIRPPADPEGLRRAVSTVADFDFIVFTSFNGVETFFSALAGAGLDARAMAGCTLCAVGPHTAGRLSSYGVHADITAETHTTEGLADAIKQHGGLDGARVLCPRSARAPRDLIDILQEAGADVTAVEAYTVAEDNSNADAVRKLLAGGGASDVWLTFASASAVEFFFRAFESSAIAGSGARIASIGPRTTRVLERAGLSAGVEARPHTAEGLIGAIARKQCTADASPQ